MYQVCFDHEICKWRLAGVAGCRVTLTFEQAVVTSPGHPLKSGVEIRAVHGLEITPEQEALIHPNELRKLGLVKGVRLRQGYHLWRLNEDGSVEQGT